MTDDVQRRTAANRRVVADLCAELTEEQLATPSLCAGWTCREVLGHLVMSVELSTPRFLLEVLRDRGQAARTSDRLARRFGARPAPELVRALRERSAAEVAPPGIGPLGPFADSCIHLRDIAVPLGLPTTAPPEDWAQVLAFLVTPRAARAGFVSRDRLAGLRLVATDGSWSSGTGSEVRGPAEALALAVSGRSAGLPDLDGDGVDLLRQRITPG